MDRKGIATPIAEMPRLTRKTPKTKVLFSPTPGAKKLTRLHRYVIDFGEGSEEECRKRLLDLMAIVEDKVYGTPARRHGGSWRGYEPSFSERSRVSRICSRSWRTGKTILRSKRQARRTTSFGSERDPEVLKLRELHAAMDRAALDATAGATFRPTAIEWGDKKKPWRCRRPDEVRDDVFARLLELSAERA
jgi:hypothetical protein